MKLMYHYPLLIDRDNRSNDLKRRLFNLMKPEVLLRSSKYFCRHRSNRMRLLRRLSTTPVAINFSSLSHDTHIDKAMYSERYQKWLCVSRDRHKFITLFLAQPGLYPGYSNRSQPAECWSIFTVTIEWSIRKNNNSGWIYNRGNISAVVIVNCVIILLQFQVFGYNSVIILCYNFGWYMCYNFGFF